MTYPQGYKHLTLEDFLILSAHTTKVMVFREIPALTLEVPDIMGALKSAFDVDGMIFEARQDKGDIHSWIAFDALATFEKRLDPGVLNASEKMAELRQLMNAFSCAAPTNKVDFTGGAMGFMSYDAVRFMEEIPDQHPNASDIPEIYFNFYRIHIHLDPQQSKITIYVMTVIEGLPEATYHKAVAEIDGLVAKLRNPQKNVSKDIYAPPHEAPVAFVPEAEDVDFIAKIKRAKAHITQGDAFQIVLSRCFKRQTTATPLDIYGALRTISPMPYLFYCTYKGRVFLGASPEQLINVRHRAVSVAPIAGTRPCLNPKDRPFIAERAT